MHAEQVIRCKQTGRFSPTNEPHHSSRIRSVLRVSLALLRQAELVPLFSTVGSVLDCAIMRDPATGESKGFAFITMETRDDAEKAIKQLNGFRIGRKYLKVELKIVKPTMQTRAAHAQTAAAPVTAATARTRTTTHRGNERARIGYESQLPMHMMPEPNYEMPPFSPYTQQPRHEVPPGPPPYPPVPRHQVSPVSPPLAYHYPLPTSPLIHSSASHSIPVPASVDFHPIPPESTRSMISPGPSTVVGSSHISHSANASLVHLSSALQRASLSSGSSLSIPPSIPSSSFTSMTPAAASGIEAADPRLRYADARAGHVTRCPP